jgi:hypothetical protein
MDERIENFLLDVLEGEGKSSNVVRATTRCYLSLYLEMVPRERGAGVQKGRGCPAMSRLVSPARVART